MEKNLSLPISKNELSELHAGDMVYITGTIYTARDAAHKRMSEEIKICLENFRKKTDCNCNPFFTMF